MSKQKNFRNAISKRVYSYPCMFNEGFLPEELEAIKKEYTLDEEPFYDALMGITGILKNGKFLTYRCDVETALICGVERRKINTYEWD